MAEASDTDLIGLAWSNVLARERPIPQTADAGTRLPAVAGAVSHKAGVKAAPSTPVVPSCVGEGEGARCCRGRACDSDLQQGQLLLGGSAVYAADGSAILML